MKWDKYGVVDGKARDPRCENCMVHCGYDPSGALGTNYQRGDNWKNFKYNFWPRPEAVRGQTRAGQNASSTAFSIGKGHLAPAKAALQKAGLTQEGADSEFYIRQMQGARPANGGCGDTTQRDDLLAKIKDVKKIEVKAD